MVEHVIIALDWLQTNYHYEVVYCYIVHSSLWPNARRRSPNVLRSVFFVLFTLSRFTFCWLLFARERELF